MKKYLKRYIPQGIIKKLKDVVDLGYTVSDLFIKDNDSLTPSHRLRKLVGPSIGARNYRLIGEEYLAYLKNECGLMPSAHVLDVGCGCGQMAVELAGYLNGQASYEGFDIIPSLVEWCEKNIASRYPNFSFQVADVFNKTYNPQGQCSASGYRFPYQDESFDFIFLKSVFTHMLTSDVLNYLKQIKRVLKKDGKCLITYFLLNDNSLPCIENRTSTLDFKYVYDNYRLIDKELPERAVAYDEGFIKGVYKDIGLSLVKQIRYGSWPQAIMRNYLAYQDIILAEK